MFLVTRIVNGLVALIALLMILMLLPALAAPVTKIMIAAFGFIVFLYVLDLLFRRKNMKGDMRFAAVWTLLFTYATYRSLLVLVALTPEEIDGNDPLLVYGTFIVVYVIPCIFNSMYFGHLFFKKMKAT